MYKNDINIFMYIKIYIETHIYLSLIYLYILFIKCKKRDGRRDSDLCLDLTSV